MAICAGLLYALEPTSIIFTSLLLSETLFAFLLTLSATLMLAYFKFRRGISILLSCLAMVAAIFTRPAAYYLPALIGVLLIIDALTHKGNRKSLFAAVFLYLAVSSSMLAGWQIRNYQQTGYSGFSTISDHNLYTYNAGMLLSSLSGQPYSQVQSELIHRVEQLASDNHWPVAEMSAYKRAEGLRIIFANPFQYLKIWMRGTFLTAVGSNSAEYLHALGLNAIDKNISIVDSRLGLLSSLYVFLSPRTQILILYIGLESIVLFLWLTAFTGITALWSKSTDGSKLRRSAVALLGSLITYFLLIAGPIGYGRFRQPIMPFICVFAGVGILFLLQQKAIWQQRRKAPNLMRGLETN